MFSVLGSILSGGAVPYYYFCVHVQWGGTEVRDSRRGGIEVRVPWHGSRSDDFSAPRPTYAPRSSVSTPPPFSGGRCGSRRLRHPRHATQAAGRVLVSRFCGGGGPPGTHTAASLTKAAARRVASVATLRNATMSVSDLRRSFTSSLRCFRSSRMALTKKPLLSASRVATAAQ